MKTKTLFLLIIIAFSACKTLKKQQRKAEAFYREYPERLAQQCAESFHSKDSTGKSDTVYIPANNIDYTSKIDSLNDAISDILSNHPSVVYDSNCIYEYNRLLKDQAELKNKISDLQKSYKACEADTFHVTDTVYRAFPELLASNAYLKFQNDSLRTELIKVNALKDKAESKSEKRFWIIVVLCGAMGVGIYLKIRKIL